MSDNCLNDYITFAITANEITGELIAIRGVCERAREEPSNNTAENGKRLQIVADGVRYLRNGCVGPPVTGYYVRVQILVAETDAVDRSAHLTVDPLRNTWNTFHFLS